MKNRLLIFLITLLGVVGPHTFGQESLRSYSIVPPSPEVSALLEYSLPEKLDVYRGMQIDTEGDVIIISSARDIGNMGAGYIAGFYGFSWPSARLIFDFVQGDFRHIEEEGLSTQNAEKYGFDIGQDDNWLPFPIIHLTF